MGRPSYSETVRIAYEAAGDPGRWPDVIGAVAEHVGALGGILVFNDISANSGRIVTGGGLRPDLGEIYVGHHIRNPWTTAITEQNPSGPVVANAIIADTRDVFRSAFAADVLDPQGIRDLICFAHPMFSTPGTSGGFGFGLNAQQDDEADLIAQRVTRVIPHLSRALELGADVARGRREWGDAIPLIDILPNPAMLLDARGRLIQVNGAAETTFADGTILRYDAGGGIRLAPPWRTSETRLGAMIERALAPIDDQADVPRWGLRLPRGADLPPVVLLLTPLAPTPFDFWEMVKPGARLLLQLIDPLVDPRTDAGLLRQVFGFTPTETTVARLIARGLSAPQIARATGSRPSTVRTHIARLFEKTGVHSQVALARLLSAMADGRARGG